MQMIDGDPIDLATDAGERTERTAAIARIR